MAATSVDAGRLPVAESVEAFLDRQLDKFPQPQGYPHGFEGARLIQTYDLEPPEELAGEDPLRHRADIYDSALAAIFYIQRGRLDRARQLVDGIRLVQSLDHFGDGRVRASYYANDLLNPQMNGPSISSPAAYTGNVAWAGIALTRFYDAAQRADYLTASERAAYLDAAVRAAQWIVEHTRQERTADDPFGGFSVGEDGEGRPIHGSTQVRATEHNTDVYTLGLNLFAVDPDPERRAVWRDMADHAAHFVRAVFDPESGRYWIGTRPAPKTRKTVVNRTPIPADCQTWPSLAGLDSAERASSALRWLTDPASNMFAAETIACSSGAEIVLSGTRFTNAGRHVQIEMTAGAAMALWLRDRKEDARGLIRSIETARLRAHTADPRGIGHVATAWPSGADTGMGDTYPAVRHVASTAWSGLLQLVTTNDPLANPFQPLPPGTAAAGGGASSSSTF